MIGCGCPVIKSAGHRPSPLRQQESHHAGSIRMRPIRAIKSHSTALKASYLSPSGFIQDSVRELSFSWPTMSQAPPTYVAEPQVSDKLTLPQERAPRAHCGATCCRRGPSARNCLAKGPEKETKPPAILQTHSLPAPRPTPSPWGCCLIPRDGYYGDYFAFM